jgi:SAM-dependent methyltransferase
VQSSVSIQRMGQSIAPSPREGGEAGHAWIVHFARSLLVKRNLKCICFVARSFCRRTCHRGHVCIKMVAMSKPARADYGVDAPIAVRNMLIVCALGIISLITRVAGLWGKESPFALLGRPLISAGLAFGAMAVWMILSSKYGKVREREGYLDLLEWRGDERVLDVGCGRGLFLIGAAKRLTTGRAMGIDIWQAEDLSGNKPAAPLNNAMIEGVADRVEVQTADARKLPFDDASFDVVLSSAALHNIYNAGERQTAVREIARVLKVGGRVLIVDVRHLSQYARTLRDAGFNGEQDAARTVQNIGWSLLKILTFGSVQIGHVIGSKAR